MRRTICPSTSRRFAAENRRREARNSPKTATNPYGALRRISILLTESCGGSSESGNGLCTRSDHNDRGLGGPPGPVTAGLTVQLRPKLEIAQGQPRIPQAGTDYARQLRGINIEPWSHDALEERCGRSAQGR